MRVDAGPIIVVLGVSGIIGGVAVQVDVRGRVELRDASADLAAAPLDEAFSPRDTLIELAEEPPAGVWSFRSDALAFVLPVVGATRSDYLPAPRNPGLFEVPVDADLPTGVPWALRHGIRYAAGHRARSLVKHENGLEIAYDGFAQSGLLEWGEESRTLPGERVVRFRVEGRTLHAEESLRFDELPELVALQVAEARDRPLRVEFSCDVPHRVNVVDTAGLAEYRSFWSELPRVHQIDVDPAERVKLGWSVTPKLRVASIEHGHHYHRSLYDPIQDRVRDVAFERGFVGLPALGRDFLRTVDIFHLHWPEWIHGPDLAAHRRFIDQLRASEVRIVWTQHNREPHRKDPGYEPIYQLWAESVDAAIHHSHWGEEWMRSLFRYGDHTRHRVIPHGHFGNLMEDLAGVDRRAAEQELGLAPCDLRLGVIGAPREEKKVQMLMDAFAAVPRDDLQLLVLGLGDETPPDDPRIHAMAHAHVPRDVFNRRLATIDVLVMPIEGGNYLTTGQFADAIGLGIPAISSDGPFLVEMLGEAALVYGRGREAMEQCLRTLDPARVSAAAAASRALQPVHDWRAIGGRTADLLDEVGTAKL